MKEVKPKEYFMLDSRVVQQISIELPSRFLKRVPWVVPSSKSIGKAIKRVDKSALGAVLVVDEKLGRPLFALTNNEAVAIQCAKRKKKGKVLKKALEACRAKCRQEHPGCANLLVLITSTGSCGCGCLDEIIDQPSGDLLR